MTIKPRKRSWTIAIGVVLFCVCAGLVFGFNGPESTMLIAIGLLCGIFAIFFYLMAVWFFDASTRTKPEWAWSLQLGAIGFIMVSFVELCASIALICMFTSKMLR